MQITILSDIGASQERPRGSSFFTVLQKKQLNLIYDKQLVRLLVF